MSYLSNFLTNLDLDTQNVVHRQTMATLSRGLLKIQGPEDIAQW